jgi:transcriptional regulator with XRE-family HTH domain
MPRTSPLKARLRPQGSGKIGNRRSDGEFVLDRQIAARLRAGRALRNLSQEMLASRVGVTFQQIQKYEAARNRASASRLITIAGVLNLPPAWFFDGISGDTADPDFPAVLALAGRILRLPKREQSIVARLVDKLEMGPSIPPDVGAS